MSVVGLVISFAAEGEAELGFQECLLLQKWSEGSGASVLGCIVF